MATEQHDITVGDTLTPLGCKCVQRDTNNVLGAANLTGLAVKFTLTNAAGVKLVDESETGVTVTDAPNGKVQYEFQPADVVAAGTYYGWFTVYSGGKHDTFPKGGRKFVIQISDRA